MFDPPKDGIVTCVKTSSGKVCSLACKEGFDFTETPALFYVCKNSAWSYVSLAPGDLSVPWPQKCEGRLFFMCFCNLYFSIITWLNTHISLTSCSVFKTISN